MRFTALVLMGCTSPLSNAPPSQTHPALSTEPAAAECAADAEPAATSERITYISVVQGQRRVVYTRRRDVRPRTPSGGAPVFQYSEGGGRALSLTVLTPEGLCTTTAARSLTASLNCGRRSGAWTGFELSGCAFPEAGPLVVFQGHEPLRVQSLVELPPASGEGAAAFQSRLHGGFDFEETTTYGLLESRQMQREMEAMQRAQAGLPPAPPPPEARLGSARLGSARLGSARLGSARHDANGVRSLVDRCPERPWSSTDGHRDLPRLCTAPAPRKPVAHARRRSAQHRLCVPHRYARLLLAHRGSGARRCLASSALQCGPAFRVHRAGEVRRSLADP